jgi:hypothetical protein
MSGRHDQDHARARELAALRVDERLDPREDAWLDAHLLGCDACTRVAADYDAQRSLFAPARAALPVPPRDLWARTAAAIDDASPTPRRTGLSRLYAPLAGAMVVAVAVGLGLLNGMPAKESTSKGDVPDATPFPLIAGEVQTISRNEDGQLEMGRQPVAEVCPLSAQTCGVIAQTEKTDTELRTTAQDWDAIISPSQDQMVVVERGDGAQAVFVLPVGSTTAIESSPEPVEATPAATEEPSSEPPTEIASATPEATDEPVATETPAESPGETVTADPGDSSPAESPDTSQAPASPSEAPGTDEPSVTSEPSPSDTTSTEAPASEPATTPIPSVEVTPRPDGAVEIASDVIVVGTTAAYSADGRHFAFTARPANGDAGPDVYVWKVGDERALAITDDHRSVFAGWLGKQLLVSRVRGNEARTVELKLSDGGTEAVYDGPMWRPTVRPDGTSGVWWDGSIRPAGDGTGWRPDRGELVLGAWPADDASKQVLGGNDLNDWAVRWDEDGTLVAVWTTNGGPDDAGALSLYTVDPGTGRADLDHPKLDKAAAFEGFSLRDGRLTWSAPADGGDTTVQVLAWKGDQIGRFELLTEDGTTVVR